MVVHVDATVVIERPKLAPVRDAMRARLAEALGLGVDHVSVKATRGEGMGFVGREEGAAALAIATVAPRVGGGALRRRSAQAAESRSSHSSQSALGWAVPRMRRVARPSR